MEGSDCVYGGYYRVVTPQFGQEKKAGGGDHFIVENLLDFSNEEVDDSGNNGGDDGVSEAGTGNSTDFSAVTAIESCNLSFSGGDQYFSGDRSVVDASLSGDLCEPLQYDELAELEWLSNFVEDSFSSEDLQKLQLISGVKSGPRSLLGVGSNSASSDARGSDVPSSAGKLTDQQPVPFLPEAIAVPGKPRSKRSRAAPCNWSSHLLVVSPIAATPSSDSILLNPNPLKKTLKPAKKKEPGSGGLALMGATEDRKCLHCATEKTPQWRTGPMGPKTLCNACGVRYKSGRLVPEYRPAASPTFVLSKHSNCHRKVLELRREKEMQQDNQQQLVHQRPKVYDGGAAGHADEFLIHRRFGPDFRQLI